MKTLVNACQRWWYRKALLGGHIAMSRDTQWGATHATIEFLGNLIEPLLVKSAFAQPSLRKLQGKLQTTTIDELTSDLFLAKMTMEKRVYVDDRLVYLDPQPRHLHSYLAMASGRALSPNEAWKTFHDMALSTMALLDTFLADTDDTDRDYYHRRYATLWMETYEVYRLFAALVGLPCPSLNR